MDTCSNKTPGSKLSLGRRGEVPAASPGAEQESCRGKGQHLCFEQAQPKMYHSPKVDDGVDAFFFNFLKTNFSTLFF